MRARTHSASYNRAPLVSLDRHRNYSGVDVPGRSLVSLDLISFALALMTVAQSPALYCSFGRWILTRNRERGERARDLYVNTRDSFR